MIRSNRAHFYLAALSHPGQSGKNNEDNFAVTAYTLSQYNPVPVIFAVVSDGIGGHRAGEVASEMTVNILCQVTEAASGGNPTEIFQQGFYRASEEIYQQAEQDATRKGMGATAACVWVTGEILYIAYAGDSRIYLMRENEIRQLSRDHTWVQEALEKGILERSEIKTHPNLHVIRRYLGAPEPPEPDLRLFLSPTDSDAKAKANQGFLLQPGDVILLCTDGLTDLVGAADIAATLKGHTLQQAAQMLIDLANARGGHDNITVVLLGVPFERAKQNPGWLPG